MKKLLLVPALAILAFAPAAVAAKKKHKVNVNSTVLAHAVSSTGNPLAGALTDPVLGNGAAVYTTTAGTPVNGVTPEKVTFQAWTALGSVKGSGNVNVTPGVNGAQTTFTGSGKVTGGTGKYKGAKGTLTFKGSFDSMNDITITATGSYTY